MPVLEISKTQDMGERCWGLTLTADEDATILLTTTSLAKGVAIATAKALRFKGPDAPLIEGTPMSSRPAWVAEKDDDTWLLRFTPVSETLFDPLVKPEDASDPKSVEHAVVEIKRSLAKIDKVTWNPPDADPAFDEKQADTTVPAELPGS